MPAGWQGAVPAPASVPFFFLPVCDDREIDKANVAVAGLLPESPDLGNCGAASAFLLGLIGAFGFKSLNKQLALGYTSSRLFAFWAGVVNRRVLKYTPIRATEDPIKFKNATVLGEAMPPLTKTIVLAANPGLPDTLGHWFVMAKRSDGTLVVIDNQTKKVYSSRFPESFNEYFKEVETRTNADGLYVLQLNQTVTRDDMEAVLAGAGDELHECRQLLAADKLACLEAKRFTLFVFTNCNPEDRFQKWLEQGEGGEGGLCKGEKRIGCAINVLAFLGWMTREEGESQVQARVAALETGEYPRTTFDEILGFLGSRLPSFDLREVVFQLPELSSMLNALEEIMKPGECTIVRFNRVDDVGHAILIGKNADGVLATYDPQTSKARARTEKDTFDAGLLGFFDRGGYTTVSLVFTRKIEDAPMAAPEEPHASSLLTLLGQSADAIAADYPALAATRFDLTRKTDLFQVPITRAAVDTFKRPAAQSEDPYNCMIVSALFLGLLTADQAEALTEIAETGVYRAYTEAYLNGLFKGANLGVKVRLYTYSNLEALFADLHPSCATLMGITSDEGGHMVVYIKDASGAPILVDPQTATFAQTADEIRGYLSLYKSDEFRAYKFDKEFTGEELIKLAKKTSSTCNQSAFNVFPEIRLREACNDREDSHVCLSEQGWRPIKVTTDYSANINSWLEFGKPLCYASGEAALDKGCFLNVAAAVGHMTREAAEDILRKESFKGTSAVETFAQLQRIARKEEKLGETLTSVIRYTETNIKHILEYLERELSNDEATVLRLNRKEGLGHAILIGKLTDGSLFVFDPQLIGLRKGVTVEQLAQYQADESQGLAEMGNYVAGVYTPDQFVGWMGKHPDFVQLVLFVAFTEPVPAGGCRHCKKQRKRRATRKLRPRGHRNPKTMKRKV